MVKREDVLTVKKEKGANCCQAILLAYKDELGLDEAFLMRMGSCFGGGMGTTYGTCGALCGAEMVTGLMKYKGENLRTTAAEVQEAFKSKCGATVCRDLKGLDTGEVLCPCDDCVLNAVDVVKTMLEKE